MSTSDFIDVVNEFFDAQGWSGQITLIKPATSVYNPSTGENTVTQNNYTMQGIVLDYVNKFQGDTTQSQTLIRTGDKQVFLKPSQYVSEIDPSADKLQIGNKIYKIITLKEMNPNLYLPLYYELFVRV